ncbi:MAG: HAD-IIB family hydrolase [Opitutales bacterium]
MRSLPVGEMNTQRKLLVVTDLDASFLNHDYTWSEAAPAIGRLRDLSIPLVLNSSKTVAEMESLARDLDLDSPIVAENGGLLAVCGQRAGDYKLEITGLARKDILQVAHDLRRQIGYKFEGFADWSDQELAVRTGLSIPIAQRAHARMATEPIVWNDTESYRLAFTRELGKKGIRMLRGGRFWHLMGTVDKADGLRSALNHYRVKEPATEWIVVALGDSANDVEMLEAAHIAVVVPHADGPHIFPKAPKVLHAPFPASRGWNDAMFSILNDFL